MRQIHQNSSLYDSQLHGGSFALTLFCVGFSARLALVLFFMLTGVDRTYRLTKDGFFYDRIGREIAEYYRSGGATEWPRRVSAVIDFLYEHLVGIVYYVTDDSMVAMRLCLSLCGRLPSI